MVGANANVTGLSMVWGNNRPVNGEVCSEDGIRQYMKAADSKMRRRKRRKIERVVREREREREGGK